LLLASLLLTSVCTPCSFPCFRFSRFLPPRPLPSFPTRRSSDLRRRIRRSAQSVQHRRAHRLGVAVGLSRTEAHLRGLFLSRGGADRKSTRLNSSHEWISYAVFCLKKKKKQDCRLMMPTHYR